MKIFIIDKSKVKTFKDFQKQYENARECTQEEKDGVFVIINKIKS